MSENFEGHTPGPWGVERTDANNWIGPLRKDGSGKVAEIVCSTERGPLKVESLSESDANAHLIAFAPDLLRERDEAAARITKLESAVKSLVGSLEGLGRWKDGKTLFEGNPTRDKECGNAWFALHDAMHLAREVVGLKSKF